MSKGPKRRVYRLRFAGVLQLEGQLGDGRRHLKKVSATQEQSFCKKRQRHHIDFEDAEFDIGLGGAGHRGGDLPASRETWHNVLALPRPLRQKRRPRTKSKHEQQQRKMDDLFGDLACVDDHFLTSLVLLLHSDSMPIRLLVTLDLGTSSLAIATACTEATPACVVTSKSGCEDLF